MNEQVLHIPDGSNSLPFALLVIFCVDLLSRKFSLGEGINTVEQDEEEDDDQGLGKTVKTEQDEEAEMPFSWQEFLHYYYDLVKKDYVEVGETLMHFHRV